MNIYKTFLGSFSVQGRRDSSYAASPQNNVVFQWKDRTQHVQECSPSVAWEKEKYIQLQGKQAVTTQIWSDRDGVQATRWLNNGVPIPAMGNGMALWDQHGGWSHPEWLLYRVPLSLDGTFSQIVHVEAEDSQQWIQIHPTVDGEQTSWEAQIDWRNLRLGMNRAHFRMTDANRQSFQYQINAIGKADAISLSPWTGDWQKNRLYQRVQLQQHNNFTFTTLVRLSFCGIGHLRGVLIFPSDGNLRQFEITNWNPLAEVIQEEEISLSGEQAMRYAKQPIVCTVETDSSVMGLHQMDVWSQKNWETNLFPWPSVLFLTKEHPVSVEFYNTKYPFPRSKHCPIDSNWFWEIPLPWREYIQVCKTSSSLEFSLQHIEDAQFPEPSSFCLRIWNSAGDYCILPVKIQIALDRLHKKARQWSKNVW